MIGSITPGSNLKNGSSSSTLTPRGIRWEDVGTFGTESVDYPDLAFKVAQAVSSREGPPRDPDLRDRDRHVHHGQSFSEGSGGAL